MKATQRAIRLADGRGLFLLGGLLVIPLLTGFALLGAWWAKWTQAVFNATSFFRRLPEEDQEAALALLGETVDARGPRTATRS